MENSDVNILYFQLYWKQTDKGHEILKSKLIELKNRIETLRESMKDIQPKLRKMRNSELQKLKKKSIKKRWSMRNGLNEQLKEGSQKYTELMEKSIELDKKYSHLQYVLKNYQRKTELIMTKLKEESDTLETEFTNLKKPKLNLENIKMKLKELNWKLEIEKEIQKRLLRRLEQKKFFNQSEMNSYHTFL